MYVYINNFLLLIWFDAISDDNYFASFSLSRIGWVHSSFRIGCFRPQRGGGSPAGQRGQYRGEEQCKEMVEQAIGCRHTCVCTLVGMYCMYVCMYFQEVYRLFWEYDS